MDDFLMALLLAVILIAGVIWTIGDEVDALEEWFKPRAYSIVMEDGTKCFTYADSLSCDWKGEYR